MISINDLCEFEVTQRIGLCMSLAGDLKKRGGPQRVEVEVVDLAYLTSLAI